MEQPNDHSWLLESSDWLRFEDRDHSYIYLSKTASIHPFGEIEVEMAQLNDLCKICLDTVGAKCESLYRDLNDLKSGKKVAEHPDLGDVTDELIDGLEVSELPLWESTYRFVVRAMCLLMLSAFTEKNLKLICETVSDREIKNIRGIGGEDKISALLRILGEALQIDEPQSPAFAQVREKCRRIRNRFAHGEWEEVRTEIETVSLRASFRAVADLFQRIEMALERT